jgi:TRAP-type C4-dicarboxylate transport system permease small subunit
MIATRQLSAASTWRYAAYVLKLVAAANLFAMMALSAVDVAGRYLLNAPLPGAFEITEVMMAVLVFSVLPIVTASDEHLTIGLFEHKFKGRMRWIKGTLVSLISGTFVALATWRVWLEAGRMGEIHDRTAFLGIPLAPLVYFMFAMLVLTLGALAVLTVLNARRVVAGER